MSSAPASPRLLVVGDTTVDFHPANLSASQRRLHWTPGGTGLNVARGVGLIAEPTALLSTIGRDPFGVSLREYLDGLPVSTEFLTATDRPTPITLSTPESFDGPEWYAWIADTCYGVVIPDNMFTRLGQFDWLYFSGTVLPPEAGGGEIPALLEAANDTDLSVAFDLNGRANQWSDPVAYRSTLASVLPACDLVFASMDDLAVAGVDQSLEGLLTLLPDTATMEIYLTDGDHAVIGATIREGGVTNQLSVAPPAVEVSNTAGAGDAFAAGVLSKQLAGTDSLDERLTAGVAAGSAAVGTHGGFDRSDRDRFHELEKQLNS